MSASLRAVELFHARYGGQPRWIVAAPGRVNLIGEHTDYNSGFVLPMAIGAQTVIAAGPVDALTATLYSEALGETVAFPLDLPVRPAPPQWANYVRGVIAGFRQLGHAVPGFRGVIASDVPVGGGLSSSAALEVSVATLVETMTRQILDPVQKALLCQRAEQEFAGVPSGIMDQLTAVMAIKGHALLIDCRSLEISRVDLSDPSVVIVVINTNVRHDLASGGYAARRADCEEAARRLQVPALREATPAMLNDARLDPVLSRRTRHVVSENVRTVLAARAIGARDWRRVGELMYASHASLRDDYEVSCGELDTVVDIAGDIGQPGGVFGCRMTGGGFGGSAVCLVAAEAVDAVTRAIGERYRDRTGHDATIFSTRAGDGARVIDTGLGA